MPHYGQTVVSNWYSECNETCIKIYQSQ